jgi:hypothetical protein
MTHINNKKGIVKIAAKKKTKRREGLFTSWLELRFLRPKRTAVALLRNTKQKSSHSRKSHPYLSLFSHSQIKQRDPRDGRTSRTLVSSTNVLWHILSLFTQIKNDIITVKENCVLLFCVATINVSITNQQNILIIHPPLCVKQSPRH